MSVNKMVASVRIEGAGWELLVDPVTNLSISPRTASECPIHGKLSSPGSSTRVAPSM
jgi:hypothetical protein